MNFLFDDVIRFFAMAIQVNIFVFKWIFRIIGFIFLAGRGAYRLSKGQPGWDIPFKTRFEHMHVVAGSGHGKTQMLQHSISNDMNLLKEGRGSVIVIDSQGDMIRKILSLEAVTALSEQNRLIVIDPTDIEYPPCLNLFDFGLSRLKNYSALERETLINGAIALYEYIFGALLGAELTNRQGANFRYLARLMMIVPNATIFTLIDFLREPQKVEPYINQLGGSAAEFFKGEFCHDDFAGTRKQIRDRLFGVLSSSMVLERMFSHTQNKVNIFDAMNRGSLILINTAKDLLKEDGTEIFGRFFIALISQATQERAAIPEENRKSTFVYIDEAQDYFDKSIANLLNQGRKYNVGLIISHQNLSQFDTKLRATVMGNTAIKMAGGLSAQDAHALSAEMHTTAEELLNVRKTDTHTQFMCYVKNDPQTPFPLTIRFGSLESDPRSEDGAVQAIREKNRALYCAKLMQEEEKQPVTLKAENGLVKPELL